MATYGGFNYTNFNAVNLKTTGGLRFNLDGGKAGTLSVKASVDANRQWYLPDKSGNIGITGTFTVNLPIVAATSTYSTNVTVAGVRAEDAMVCSVQNIYYTNTLSNFANNSLPLLAGCKCGNGGVNLTFINPSTTGTIYEDLVLAYTIVR